MINRKIFTVNRKIGVLVVFISSLYFSQEKRSVKDIKEIPNGWICTSISFTSTGGYGETVTNYPTFQIADGNHYPQGKELTTCRLDLVNRQTWNLQRTVDDCNQCRVNHFSPYGTVIKTPCYVIKKVSKN